MKKKVVILTSYAARPVGYRVLLQVHEDKNGKIFKSCIDSGLLSVSLMEFNPVSSRLIAQL